MPLNSVEQLGMKCGISISGVQIRVEPAKPITSPARHARAERVRVRNRASDDVGALSQVRHDPVTHTDASRVN